MALFARSSIIAIVLLSTTLSVMVHWVASADDVCPYHDDKDEDQSDEGGAPLGGGVARRKDSLYLLNGEVDDTRSRLNLVVVAGAWRRPDGSLSRAFAHRVVHGARMAILFGAKDVLLTGGLNDSAVALEYLNTMSNASVVLFPLPWVQALDDNARSAARRLRTALAHYDHLPLIEALSRLELSEPAGDAAALDESQAPIQWPSFHIENASLTTYGNAIETRWWLEGQHGGALREGGPLCDEPLHVLVVSSQYHNRRCKMLFTKVLHQRDTNHSGVCRRRTEPQKLIHVVTSGAIGSMFELVFPEEWVSFASVPSPSMARAPLFLGGSS
jgi:uncharacterized SAM-binding protein YcdF (DUF218 family)